MMPLHIQITITLIIGSILLCILLGVSGPILRKMSGGLPAVPLFPGSNFPNLFAVFYTVFFIITFGMASIAQCMDYSAQKDQDTDLLNLIFSAVVQCALYIPFLVIYFSQPRRLFPALSPGRTIAWILLGLLVLCIPAQILELAGFNQWLIEATGCPPEQDVVETLRHGSTGVKITMLVMAVIIAPITEECCFRGFVYNILKQFASPGCAAIASAVLFSAVHASLAQFIPLAVFGLVQCFIYEKTHTLKLPIVLHVLFNALSSLFILFII